jgi:hypothetical protein
VTRDSEDEKEEAIEREYEQTRKSTLEPKIWFFSGLALLVAGFVGMMAFGSKDSSMWPTFGPAVVGVCVAFIGWIKLGSTWADNRVLRDKISRKYKPEPPEPSFKKSVELFQKTVREFEEKDKNRQLEDLDHELELEKRRRKIKEAQEGIVDTPKAEQPKPLTRLQKRAKIRAEIKQLQRECEEDLKGIPEDPPELQEQHRRGCEEKIRRKMNELLNL